MPQETLWFYFLFLLPDIPLFTLLLWCRYHVSTGCSLWGAPHPDLQTQCGMKLPLKSVFLQWLSCLSNLLILCLPLKFNKRNGSKERLRSLISSLSFSSTWRRSFLPIFGNDIPHSLITYCFFYFFFRHHLHILCSNSLVTISHNASCIVKGLWGNMTDRKNKNAENICQMYSLQMVLNEQLFI